MAFIANWAIDKVQTTAAGYLKTGLQAGGNMAGNAVGGVGTLIETSGRSLGEGSKFTYAHLATLYKHLLSTTVSLTRHPPQPSEAALKA